MKEKMRANLFVVVPVLIIILLFCLIVGVAYQKKKETEKTTSKETTEKAQLQSYLHSLPSPVVTSKDGDSDYNYITNGESLWDSAGNTLSIDYYEKLSENVNKIMTDNGYKGEACRVNGINIYGLKCNLSFDIGDTKDKLFINSDYAERTFEGYIKKAGN